jgi:hypothetical protein
VLYVPPFTIRYDNIAQGSFFCREAAMVDWFVFQIDCKTVAIVIGLLASLATAFCTNYRIGIS